MQLEMLRRAALAAPDYMFRDHQIFLVNMLLEDMQAQGIISADERRALASEWIKNYVRGFLPMLYRDKRAKAINRLSCLLQAG